MKVSELAKKADVSAETVRFYTREKLLDPTKNEDNNYKIYTSKDLQRLKFIRKARQLGFSLTNISAIMNKADNHDSPCPMVRMLFEDQLAKVDKQIAELQLLRNRMVEAMQLWTTMPDGEPDGKTICRLIENWEDPDC